MKPITLYVHEARRLQAAGGVTLVRPIKPPPSEQRAPDGGVMYKWHGYYWRDVMPPDMLEDCPYGFTGDSRWCREVWRPSPDGVPYGIEYQADNLLRWFDGTDAGVEAKARLLIRDGRWRSPVTMPRWASRYVVTVQSTTFKRVAEIDDGVGLDAGWDDPTRWQNPRDDLLEWYNTKFPKSPWCWHVEIVRAKEDTP